MDDETVDREIDAIGVIARVAPEDKVHLVDILKRKGHVVAMTGDGVNDAPALKKADIGVAMGITGTEVSKEAAVMILTDDNFATIVKAVELGRALYDNLVRYIRFQMAGLFGFIATFLGASLLFIAQGTPFLPLQTLWINFTVQVFLAIGLGYGKARDGLMSDAPRPPVQPILLAPADRLAGHRGPRDGRRDAGRHLVGDRAVRRGRRPDDGPRRLLADQHLVRARDVERGAARCSARESSPTRRCSRWPALALLATFATSEIGLLNRLLGTVNLTPEQWGICVVARSRSSCWRGQEAAQDPDDRGRGPGRARRRRPPPPDRGPSAAQRWRRSSSPASAASSTASLRDEAPSFP